MIAYIAMTDFEVDLERGADPALRNRSVIIVHGDPIRAVVRCCSSDLATAGIIKGARVSDVRRRYPQAAVLQERASHYEDCSRRITLDLIERVPALEKSDLAAWVVDLNGCERLLNNDFLGWAQKIARYLQKRWNLTTSVGFASNKVTAAFACRLARSGSAVLLLPWGETELMGNAPLDFLPDVSRRTRDFMEGKRLHWAWELKELGAGRLRHWLGARDGNQLWDVINGRCIEPVRPLSLPPLLSQSFTFSRATSSAQDVVQAGIFLMGNMLYDARKRGGFLRRVSGEIIYADNHACRRQTHLAEATHDSDYYQSVSQMLESALARRVQVRSLTLSAPIDSEPAQQADFFSEKERVKRLDLECALAEIRDKYGYRLLRPASGLPRRGTLKKKFSRQP